MPDHEGHLLGRDVLRRDDEVAFVFAIRRVEHDDELAVPERVDGVLDAVEVELRGCSIRWHLGAAAVLLDVVELSRKEYHQQTDSWFRLGIVCKCEVLGLV